MSHGGRCATQRKGLTINQIVGVMCRKVSRMPLPPHLRPAKVDGPQRRPDRMARGEGSYDISGGDDLGSKMGTQARISWADVTNGSRGPPLGRRLPEAIRCGPWAICKPAGVAQEVGAVWDENTLITPGRLHWQGDIPRMCLSWLRARM